MAHITAFKQCDMSAIVCIEYRVNVLLTILDSWKEMAVPKIGLFSIPQVFMISVVFKMIRIFFERSDLIQHVS